MPHIYAMHHIGKGGRTRCGKPIARMLTHCVTDNINDVTCATCRRSWGKGKGQYYPACKTCPSCYRLSPNATRRCYSCGYEFRVGRLT